MNVWDAWKLLGKDPRIIMNTIINAGSLQRKYEIVEDTLKLAKKLSKKAMAQYHPDVNDDPNAPIMFNRIQEAFQIIEYNSKRLQEKILEKKNAKEKNPVIIITDR